MKYNKCTMITWSNIEEFQIYINLKLYKFTYWSILIDFWIFLIKFFILLKLLDLMIKLYTCLFLFLTLIMIALLYPEISSLPSLRDSLSIFSGELSSPTILLILLLLDLIFLPMILITIILINFKKYMFNDTKDIKKSYNVLLNCLLISYLQCTIYDILLFFI